MLEYKKCNTKIIYTLENGFYLWGCFVARHPWIVIIASIFITGLCSIGFLNLSFETDGNKMWGPQGGSYMNNSKWLDEFFPQDNRVQTIIFRSKEPDGNILSPESLRYMYSVHKKILKLKPNGVSFEDICQR